MVVPCHLSKHLCQIVAICLLRSDDLYFEPFVIPFDCSNYNTFNIDETVTDIKIEVSVKWFLVRNIVFRTQPVIFLLTKKGIKMIKKSFNASVAQITCVVDFPIYEMSDTRSAAFEHYLSEQLPRLRDVSNEHFYLARSCEVCCVLNDVVRYGFPSYEVAIEGIEKVSELIDQIGEQWLKLEDEAFFGMTREEEDQRANRLSTKSLNGIVDDEVIDADARYFRNLELLKGRRHSDAMKKVDALLFRARS